MMGSIDKDTMRAERDRQAKLLEQAIADAIHQTMAAFDQPMIMAVASALVWQQGYLLKQIPDAATRKKVRKAMQDMLPAAIAAAKVTIKVETIAVRDHKLQ